MSTIFIDLDGTIVDVRERHYAVYSHACSKAGVTPLGAADYWRKRRLGASTFALHSLDEDQVREAFQEAWLSSIEQPQYLARDRPFRGSLRAMGQLVDAGHKLVLVTLRHSRPALMAQLNSLGLSAWFGGVVSPLNGADVDKSVLIARAGYLEADVVVGDSEADARAGASLGIASVCVATGVRSGAYLRRLSPTAVIGSLRELTPSLLSEIAAEGRTHRCIPASLRRR
jgi:phosphoglycolate phosphatase-like HAD superfamily hydrolase